MSNLTQAAFILKRKYAKKAADVAMRDHPTATAMPKKDGMTGPATSFFYPVKYANPQSVGSTFATIQTNGSTSNGSTGVQFQATRRKKYGVVQIDGEAIAACKDNGAFYDLLTLETEGVLAEHGDSLSFEMFRDGNGHLGRRSSESADVTTLTNAWEARNFKVGMIVTASANANGSSPRTGTTAITSVDEDNGTIGLDTSAITSYADNDYLFRATTTSTVGGIVDGLQSLFPLTAPSSGESYRGVDRSVHPNLLAGTRTSDTSAPAEDNAGLTCVKIRQAHKIRRGFGIIVMNPIDFYKMTRRQNAKVTYDGGGVKATVGFEGIDLATAAGTMRVVSDPDCPQAAGFVLDLSAIHWRTLKPWCHIIMDDGLKSLRIYNADGIEFRTRSMGNMIAEQPAAHGQFDMQS